MQTKPCILIVLALNYHAILGSAYTAFMLNLLMSCPILVQNLPIYGVIHSVKSINFHFFCAYLVSFG